MFRGIMGVEPGESSHLVFALFQGMFAAFTPALLVGAAGERGRILPCLVFVFAWATLVYDPIASWTWSKNGWAHRLGVLDFAGGTPVHISSGAAALAYSLFLGKRKRETEVDISSAFADGSRIMQHTSLSGRYFSGSVGLDSTEGLQEVATN
jgi:ammonium transporter, Amt family